MPECEQFTKTLAIGQLFAGTAATYLLHRLDRLADHCGHFVGLRPKAVIQHELAPILYIRHPRFLAHARISSSSCKARAPDSICCVDRPATAPRRLVTGTVSALRWSVWISRMARSHWLTVGGRVRILQDADQARASEMGETMRQLLAARQSQEMHGEALRISKVALWVSVFALVVGVPGAIASLWPLVFPSPTQVHSVQTKPVHVVQDVSQSQQAKQTQKKQLQSKSESPAGKSSHDRSKN